MLESMIVWGFRAIKATRARGVFHCPQCVIKVNYVHRKVTSWFTLYFIPIIPRETLAEYVECQKCLGTFDVETITYDPEVEKQKFEASYLAGMKRVMVQVMLADGHIASSEKQLLRGVYKSLANGDLSDEAIEAEIKSITNAKGDLLAYVRQLGNTLNDTGKERVLRAAVMVATADGALDGTEHQLLGAMAAALGVSPAQLGQLISSETGARERQATA
jgi:tellurite resistance protein